MRSTKGGKGFNKNDFPESSDAAAKRRGALLPLVLSSASPATTSKAPVIHPDGTRGGRLPAGLCRIEAGAEQVFFFLIISFYEKLGKMVEE